VSRHLLVGFLHRLALIALQLDHTASLILVNDACGAARRQGHERPNHQTRRDRP